MHDFFKKADGPALSSTADPLREALLAHSRRLGVLAVSSGVGAGAIDAFLYQGVQLGADARRALTLSPSHSRTAASTVAPMRRSGRDKGARLADEYDADRPATKNPTKHEA